MKHLTKPEDSPLWRKTLEIAVDAHDAVALLPRDDEWGVADQLHQHAFEAVHNVAEAVGGLDPRDVMHLLSRARADLFVIKSCYAFGFKTGELGERSETMVLIGEAVKLLDQELVGIDDDIRAWDEAMSATAAAPQELPYEN